MGKNIRETLNEQMKNPDLKKEYAAIEKSNIEKLFKNFVGEYEPIDANFGEPVGNEIL